MRTLGLDLSWGTRPKFGGGRGVCIGLAHEDFGLRFELQPRPKLVMDYCIRFAQ